MSNTDGQAPAQMHCIGISRVVLWLVSILTRVPGDSYTRQVGKHTLLSTMGVITVPPSWAVGGINESALCWHIASQ